MADNKTIHILSAEDSLTSDEYKHYMLNTTTGDWEGNITSFPYPSFVMQGTLVVYNNEVHWLGGINSTIRKHYKWNGVEWEEISDLPYAASNSCAVVYNNEIHLLGGASSTRHYKWNGTSWTEASTLPEGFIGQFAVVYDNAIHVLGGITNNKHYKWNGTTWSEVSTLPYNIKDNVNTVVAGVVVYDNAIHILGGYDNGVLTNHYKWNGSSWSEVSTLPYSANKPTVIVFDNKIHLMSGDNEEICRYHYTWDGTSWTKESDAPWRTLRSARAIVYDYDYIVDPTKNFVDYDNATALMEGINQSKENRFRFSEMPTPSADWLGKSIQYIGTTTVTEPIYTHNHFYECKTKIVEGQTVYYWDSTEPTIKPITNAQIDAWWNGGN